jgi:zinc protease
MNKPLSTSSMPLICKGPMTDTAVAAMARLESTQGLDLEQHQPLPAQIQQWQTDEGAKVSFMPSHDRPIFDLALRFRAGSALDGTSPGLAALVLYSLDQGTEHLDAAQFAQAIEGLGAIMARQMNQDEAVITLRCLSLPALRTSALQLLTQMLARPAFREEAVAGIRERLLNYLGAMASTPVFGMSHATMSHVFDGHPYATHWAGTPESLNQIDEQQLRDFHRRAYSANNLDIGLVGDLSRDEAQTLITELLQALPQHWAGQPPPPAPLPEALTRHQEHTASTTRATLTLLLPISPDKPGYAALTMLDEILGSGFESRLTQELRSRRTLTYTIRSSLKPFDAASLLQIEWDIAPQYRDASKPGGVRHGAQPDRRQVASHHGEQRRAGQEPGNVKPPWPTCRSFCNLHPKPGSPDAQGHSRSRAHMAEPCAGSVHHSRPAPCATTFARAALTDQ